MEDTANKPIVNKQVGAWTGRPKHQGGIAYLDACPPGVTHC